MNSLDAKVRRQIYATLGTKEPIDDRELLERCIRHLGKWRSVLIQNTILKLHGTTIMQGPLAGLDFIETSAEGCHAAKLIGCYEQPLHPAIQDAIENEYESIINIGCAEGYYAVGMARKMPNTHVFAFDIDENAQNVCRNLAAKNNVSDRVTVGELFTNDDFASYKNSKTLVICDIEGAEKELLDPEKSPALSNMDIITEAHECFIPGIIELLTERFKETHDIQIIRDGGDRKLDDMPEWYTNLSHQDQLLALWEWRVGATPWLVMKVKAV